MMTSSPPMADETRKQSTPIKWQSPALVLIPLVFVLGLVAVEFQSFQNQKTMLQRATEKAVLAEAAQLLQSQEEPNSQEVYQKIQADLERSGAESGILKKDKPQSLQVDSVETFKDDVKQARRRLLKIVTSCRTDTVLLKYLGFPGFVINAEALAGKPEVAVLICFDVSGAKDDLTSISLVQRVYDPNTKRNAYNLVSSGKLSEVFPATALGSQIGALAPQNLHLASNATIPHAYNFRPDLRSSGQTDDGLPPGNKDLKLPPVQDKDFTDLLVNVGPESTYQFKPFSKDGYDFNSLATLTEAARGNLETDEVFKSSGAYTNPEVHGPQPGIKTIYTQMAQEATMPLWTAQKAVETAVDALPAQAAIGLFAFETECAPYEKDVWNVALGYKPGGGRRWSLPLIPIKAGTKTDIKMTIYQLVPMRETKLGLNLDKAVKILPKAEAGLRRVLLLVTDGITAPPYDASEARDIAVGAAKDGVNIYTIGLPVKPQLAGMQDQLLNDSNDSTKDGGIAAITGSKFIPAQQVDTVSKTMKELGNEVVLFK